VSLLALLAALAAQYAFPPRPRQWLARLYGRLALSADKRLNAGDRNSGIVAGLALAALVLGPVVLATAVASAIHPVLVWALDVAFLYGTVRFLETTRELGAIERRLREGDVTGAANRFAEWRGEPTALPDGGSVATLAAEHALREAHYGTFAPLFWFLVLPGPIGLVLHPLARRAALAWSRPADPEDRDFAWFAERAFFVIDWIPQRLTAFTFAMVGDFEDALFCWRSQAAQWLEPAEGIVLASGAGALGARLGDPIPEGESFRPRPALGLGEAAREDTLASLEGLLWRGWVVWLVAFLLAAALQVA
jgi:cobalamin biosynthesis protein CobD/CbiB